MSSCRCAVSCIAPPHILKYLAEHGDGRLREAARNTLLTSDYLRGERSVRAMSAVLAAPDTGRRTVYDCRQRESLPDSVLARTEDGQSSADKSVNRAFEGFGKTRDFYGKVLGRDSIDDRGMRLNGYVHYGKQYQNAFWDGQEMVFGDGDGEVFTDFTASLDVIAHELTHGVIEYTANLDYHNQPGALNESIADVFGVLVRQWSLKQTAAKADWLIGADLFTPKLPGDALRSMKAPGTAYDNELIGRDPQPAHMRDFKQLADTRGGDWGGVHINSGIPNHAFYLAAIAIGGNAWEAPGHIWYESLKASNATTNFEEFADTTALKATQLYGATSNERKAIAAAWEEVGIHVHSASGPKPSRVGERNGSGADGVADLQERIEVLLAEVREVATEVAALAGRE
jgi:Zn-dependent metalloprotease